MAGDWIKIEKGAGHKPEVLTIARMLNIKRREAYGLLVEFWEWLDSNCVDGVVDGVVDADVDALMSCPGISALLKLVGWVEFELEPPRLRVINFSRHNGETSKNRALRNRRQAKWRLNSVDVSVDSGASTKASTREEKRREDINTRAHARKTAATEMPAGFALSDRVRAWAAAKGFDQLEAHFEHFIGQAKAKAYRYADWDQALMNAIRNNWAKLAPIQDRRVAL